MDLQTIVDNHFRAARAVTMLNSDQLTLGELILKLEAIQDKSLPIIFDEGPYKPTGLGSWRGAYAELAIQYEEGGQSCYGQNEPDCKRDEYGYRSYDCPCGGPEKTETTLPKDPTTEDLLKVMKAVLGKYMIGYKGGEYTLGKTTPVWVANYGNCTGFKGDISNEKDYQAVVDVVQTGTYVSIATLPMDY